MKAFAPAIIVAVLIISLWLFLGIFGGWKVAHRRLIGALIFVYGAYLATLTGTATQFILPGFGAIGGGAAAGAGIGILTFWAIGTVGVATGGVGIAIGAGLMAIGGAVLGAAGGAAGAWGFHTVHYPLVSPFFWVPLIALSIYLIFWKSRKSKHAAAQLLPTQVEPEN